MKLFKKKCKKGSVLDAAIVIPLSLFMIALMVVIGYFFVSEMDLAAQEDQTFLENNESIEFIQTAKESMTVFDYGFLFLMIGMAIAAIAAGYYTRTYPVFCTVFIIVLIISSILLAYLSNTFEEFIIGEFAASASAFPIISNIMQFFPYVIGLITVAVIIITFAKGD